MAGAPNGVSYKNNTHKTEYFYTLLSKGCSCMSRKDAFRSLSSGRFYSSMSSALCSVPASKTAVTNTYHQSNQGKITNDFSLKECRLRGLFPNRTRLFNILFGRHFASDECNFSRARDVLIFLVFPHDYICAFLTV